MDIRSYRAVFELERRIYRIDTIRLNPGGVPLRGVAYAGVLVLGTAIASRIEPVRLVLAPLPWYVRYLGIPIAGAALATMIRIEGRPFHLAAWAIAAHHWAPRHTCHLEPAAAPGARWQPRPVVLIPDGSDSRFRRLRFRGPGVVLVCRAHDRVEWPRTSFGTMRHAATVTLHGREGALPLGRPAALELPAGTTIETRSDALRGQR